MLPGQILPSLTGLLQGVCWQSALLWASGSSLCPPYLSVPLVGCPPSLLPQLPMEVTQGMLMPVLGYHLLGFV